MIYPTTDQVVAMHDRILFEGELSGMAGDKSIDGALARVENRLAYGLLADPFDLAAACAEAIAQGHCFNDGNKRTAYRVMLVTLAMNGVDLVHNTEDIGDRVVLLAQRKLEAGDLAAWLRDRVTASA